MNSAKIVSVLRFSVISILIAGVLILTQRVNKLEKNTGSIEEALKERDRKILEYTNQQEKQQKELLFLMGGCPDGVDGGD